MGLILYGLLLAHLTMYKDQYMNIGITFAVTVVFKKLIKAGGNIDHADLVGLGGYTLSIGEFVKLLGKMKSAGSVIGNSEENGKIVGGLLGDALDLIKSIGK